MANPRSAERLCDASDREDRYIDQAVSLLRRYHAALAADSRGHHPDSDSDSAKALRSEQLRAWAELLRLVVDGLRFRNPS